MRSASLLLFLGLSSGLGSVSTSIYVDRHFEVRDHDEPVKYIFNRDIRVARVTGSLGRPLRIQRFRLSSGWNLLSVAVSATNGLHQVTNGHPSVLRAESIFTWNQPTLTWVPLPPGQMPAGTILWLHAATNAVLALVGTYAEPTNRTVNAGGAFLPSAGLERWDVRSALSTMPSAFAWTFDASVPRWLSWLSSPLSSPSDLPDFIAPGAAVFLRADVSAELAVAKSALRVRYYHEDHLGSSAVLTDNEGSILEETAFYPFGHTRTRHRSGLVDEPYTFTRKENDVESGLHYFEARYLNGGLSRFITTDFKYVNMDRLSVSEFNAYLLNPQRANLYSYVDNNPLNKIDPTGLDTSTPLDGRTVERKKGGIATVTLSDGRKVTILPDKVVQKTHTGKQAETELDIKDNYNPKKKTVTVSITIRTYYKAGVNPAGKQSYGRGTTDEDKESGNTSIKFHEGMHGKDYLDFLENNPLPKFEPGKEPFMAAAKKYKEALDKYHAEAIEHSKEQTDCSDNPGPMCH